MKRMYIVNASIIVLLLFCLNGFASAPCNLTPTFHNSSLSSCSFILEDKEQKHNEKDVVKLLVKNQFKPSENGINENRNLHWLSFSLTQDHVDSLLILIKFSDLRGVWVIKNDSLTPIDYAGYLPEYDTFYGTVFKDNHRFIYILSRGDTIQFLCKTYPKYLEHGSAEPFIYDAKMYEREQQANLSLTTFFNGLTLGMMLLFLTIAILVYFFFRHRAYLVYIIYLVFVITYVWRDFEYLNVYFFSTMKYVPWYQTKLIMNCLIGTSYIYFIKYFLNTKTDFPAVHLILNILMWLLVIIIPIDYIGSEILELWSYRFGLYYAGAVVLITQLFYNAYFIRSPDPMARYIVYGTFFLAIGAISIPLLDVAIHTWVVRICFILEMIFFTAALSQNIKKVRRAKTTAEAALKEAKIRFEYESEMKISKERELTAETIRTEIARDIHDEIGAELTKISLSSHLLSKSTKIQDEEIKEKIAKLGEDAIQANLQLRQLLFSINPDFDHFADMQAYFTELATSFFAQSDIKIHFEMKSDNFSHKVDRIVKSQLMLIYKEILNNISKHANATNVIIALNQHEPGKYILYVKDDGMGFDLEEIKMFSTGLSNIKARCERIHANLDIVSERNAGVEISIIGPIFNI